MSDNVNLTPKVMAKFVCISLGGNLHVSANMSDRITNEFGKKDYKVGDLVQVRKPYRFVAHSGIGWQPQPTVDQVTPIVVNQVNGVHWLWDSVERTLETREAMELYADPIGLALATAINTKSALFASQNALGSVGTPGSIPSSQATYLAAGDILVEQGLPTKRTPTLIVNRRMSTGYVNGTVAYFNPAGAISAQYMEGQMQNSLGYKIVQDQCIAVRTNGTWTVSGLVNLAQTASGGNNATMTLNTDGWTAASLVPGDRFVIGSSTSATVGGVNSIHPQTRQSTGHQQVFTVRQAITDSAGTVNMVISPAITPATLDIPANQYANVDIAAPDNGIITMIGTTGLTNIMQGLLLDKEAFAFVSVPLAQPGKTGVEAAETVTDPETKLSLQYVRYFDGDNRQTKHRYDCLWDNGNLYPELAVVIQS